MLFYDVVSCLFFSKVLMFWLAYVFLRLLKLAQFLL